MNEWWQFWEVKQTKCNKTENGLKIILKWTDEQSENNNSDGAAYH